MKLKIKEIALFAMLAALMVASKYIMEILPNIHLIAVFIISITVVYRVKAIYPLLIFIFAIGFINGFDVWWIPYLYIWLPLWVITLLLPKNMKPRTAAIVYMCVSALHGFLYGTLYAPAQALIFGLDLEGMIAWIISGIPFDVIHGISNFFCGLLIMPITAILKRTKEQ